MCLLQVEPGVIWCFEQEQSLAGINVVTTVRMTVVKLQNGELLIYAPIAPTRLVIRLLGTFDRYESMSMSGGPLVLRPSYVCVAVHVQDAYVKT